MAEENKDQVSGTEETQNTAADQQAEAQVQEKVEETTSNAAEVSEVVAEATEAVAAEDEAPAKKQVPTQQKVDIDTLGSEGNVGFDWESLEEEIDIYGADERTRLEDLYSDTLTTIVEKEVIDGKVISVSKKEIVINIGYKSEGVVAASEFRYNPDLAAGDVVPIFVEQQEDRNGQLIISHKTARIHSAWDRVNSSLANDEIITGLVKCRTKGGLIIDVFGIEAFLPGSQIDVKPIRDYDVYVGKQMEFKVVKINHESKNIIGGLEKGQILEGSVKNITSYGVFVDLGGVDGLVHITDLSWGRINHPEEVVELDQKIQVVILDFDDDKKRIALGLKQLSDHPWDALSEKLEIGDKV
jgi:small subunit ribosomal protein S1